MRQGWPTLVPKTRVLTLPSPPLPFLDSLVIAMRSAVSVPCVGFGGLRAPKNVVFGCTSTRAVSAWRDRRVRPCLGLTRASLVMRVNSCPFMPKMCPVWPSLRRAGGLASRFRVVSESLPSRFRVRLVYIPSDARPLRLKSCIEFTIWYIIVYCIILYCPSPPPERMPHGIPGSRGTPCRPVTLYPCRPVSRRDRVRCLVPPRDTVPWRLSGRPRRAAAAAPPRPRRHTLRA